MSKPDWKDAPKNANYLAQDADGTWEFFNAKPIIPGDWWHWEPEGKDICWDYSTGSSGEPSENWRNSLESRP